MKKLFLLIVFLFLCSGCGMMLVNEQRLINIENKLASVSLVKYDTAKGVMLLAEQAGARKFWWRNALLGGGDALDGIAYGSLADGDVSIVAPLSGTAGSFYVYIYDSSATNADAPASCTTECTSIAPNDGNGSTLGGAWQLADIYSQKLTSAAADGYHYINVSNTGAFAGVPAEGDCFWRKDTHGWCCWNSALAQWRCTVP